MPIVKPRGLQGLKGLGNLSKNQYDAFINSNRDLIAQHGYDPIYINNLYSNKQFIDKYGVDKFKAIPDINMRNDLYKADLVNTEFDKLYKPTKLNKGLGNDYNKYNQLSTDAKLKLMESDYLSPTEFENQWQKHLKENQHIGNAIEKTEWNLPDPSMGGLFSGTHSVKESFANAYKDPIKDEAVKRKAMDANQRILDKIYNDDVDTAASRFSTEVSRAYQDPLISGMSDSQVKQAFIQAITPGSYKDKNGMPNLGIAEYASHYGKGTDHDITSEMSNFSIDDMRQVLAKKKVYDSYMSPDMAATALNNDAKRYITEHQGKFKKLGLFAKDVAISSMSYTADKLNGIAELYRIGQDKFAEKPIVMVDDRGNILDPNKTHVVRDRQGNLHYQDGEGNIHSVHQEKIDYTTLHNMGKNSDGSVIEGAFGIDWMTLNPQYWTRAEQFGTLDNDEQKQYEKLGSSPYKVAYNPNEDSDLWYDAFKMMSFGLADTFSQLIPYGIGTIGKTLSTASKIGKVARGFGKVLDTTGKMLTAESKVGQAVQGTAGALGIAYAYDRGAFQETLQQNLANAEEAVSNASKNDIFNQYNKDKRYRSQVDSLINARAATMKANYIAQMRRDGGMRIADEKALDKMLHAKAQDEVLGGLVQNRVKERMSSKDYAKLQQEAINSAGDAAFNTFLPEAVKYGLVNTMGYRKFLYTNPSGLTRKMSSSLKGLKEITTSVGQKRMTTEASKFLTRGDKLKEFGKTLGSQVWGGAWTNGTDDMQVDAAERINEDSYNKYLQAYQNGEAMASTYGFADGLYSYLKGLSNSLGQETTMNSAIVGGLGSVVNFTPNFANIARLATREGRQAYKDNFRREIVRDKNGIPVRNEDGSIKYKDLGKGNNWRGQLNYFLQNGVLNTYYGKKQSEKDLQSHADYVNNLLDDYNDFVDVEHLVASNLASENRENFGDQKTMDFVRALHTVNTLNQLGKDSKDPTTMSSVVQNAKALIEKASQLNNENSPFSNGEINNLLSQYYSSHPEMEQSDANNQKALYDIAENAQKLQKASEAYDKAEKEIRKIERNKKIDISPIVRNRLKEQQALNKHWTERKGKMQSEIGDVSTDQSTESPSDAHTIIATVGGIKNAQSLVKVYARQADEIYAKIQEEETKVSPIMSEYNEAEKALSKARKEGDVNGSLKAQEIMQSANGELQNFYEKRNYLLDLVNETISKKRTYETSIHEVEDSKDSASEKKEKVLSADDIFSLDPVTRARMMREENRDLYSKEQQREIEKLEQRLLMKDADALQKVQDIALLTQRINTNQDAYARIAKNPEAAAVEFESQREEAAKTAYSLINQRNAETIVDSINQFNDGMKGHSDVTDEAKDRFVFKTLRQLNPELLDIIDKGSLLPQYQQQISNAKEWVKTVGDITAVVDNSNQDTEWKKNVMGNIDSLVEDSNNRKEIMEKLEKVVDDTDGSMASSDLEFILEGLQNMGYQRDATVLESRKARKEREAKETEERKKKEEEQKKAMEESKAAAEKKAEKTKQKVEEESSDKDTRDFSKAAVDEDSLKDVFDLRNEETDTNTKVSKKGVSVQKEENLTNENTRIDYGDTPYNITSNDYEALPNTAKHEENADFEVHSAEKVDGDWYFIGNFAGSKEQTKVKSKMNADMDKLYKEQQKESPVVKETSAHEDELIYNNVEDSSPSIEKQYEKAIANGEGNVHMSETTEDADTVNGTGEFSINNDATTLSANTMSLYDFDLLRNDGVLKRKEGKKADDTMTTYFAWMNAAGVKLQNIIDHELASILDRNPHAKVKFMMVKPEDNATHDVNMQKHLMLVLDYDNSINKGITSIHDDGNGGVIESLGKKYLIIGVAGFGNNNLAKRKLLDLLRNSNVENGFKLKVQRKKFFDEHPTERFYVNEKLSTEIPPRSLIPGYIVRQTEKDNEPKFRSVMELLGDKDRNPLGYTMENVAWGIQEMSKFLTVNTSPENVMVPRRPEGNLGSAFVLMPASNGKMVPSYLKVLKYTEMNDGTLKKRIDTLLQNAVSPNPRVGHDACTALFSIFYLNKESGDNIWRNDDGNEVYLAHNGERYKTFILDSNFDRNAFVEAIRDMNPRINITAKVLSNLDLLKEYDEAGALMTDAAMFGTAGSSYSVYGLDGEGNMIMPNAPVNETVRKGADSDFKNNQSQVIYNHQYYREADGMFSLDGKIITDDKLLEQLRYNKRIIDNKLSPAAQQGITDYYILSAGEHPVVIRVNQNTKEVRELPEDKAKTFIEKINEKKAKESREKEAEKALKDGNDAILNSAEKVNLFEDEGLEIDPQTGEAVQVKESHSQEIQEATPKNEVPKGDRGTNDLADSTVENLGNPSQEKPTQRFVDLLKNKKYQLRIRKVVKNKWNVITTKPSDLERFLRDNNIEVDAIGTSKEDIEAWIKTIEDCR